MTTAVLEPRVVAVPVQSSGRTATALRVLMHMWEQEDVTDENESETELMVMLSGMVGSHATVLDAE